MLPLLSAGLTIYMHDDMGMTIYDMGMTIYMLKPKEGRGTINSTKASAC